jgi:predicted enzyme related to lactoylglutathione lyase
MSATDRGRFVWHELNTTDSGAAERFYRSLVGWGITPFEQDPSYRMWTAAGAPQGGLMVLPEEAKRMGAPPPLAVVHRSARRGRMRPPGERVRRAHVRSAS